MKCVERPLSRSWASAGVSTKTQIRPSASTTMWRLRPAIVFSRVVAFGTGLISGLLGLAIEHQRGWFGLLLHLPPYPFPQFRVNRLPSPICLPLPKVVKDDSIGRKIVRQRSPRTTVASAVKVGIENFPPRVQCRPTAGFGCGNPRRNPSPLGVSHVCGARSPLRVQKSSRRALNQQELFLDTHLGQNRLRTGLSVSLGSSSESS